MGENVVESWLVYLEEGTSWYRAEWWKERGEVPVIGENNDS